MSTKTSNELIPYIITAFVIHAVLVLFFASPLSYMFLSKRHVRKPQAPMFVDLIDRLPVPKAITPPLTMAQSKPAPAPKPRPKPRHSRSIDIIELDSNAQGEQKAPDRVTRYSDRSMSVEKEIIPDTPGRASSSDPDARGGKGGGKSSQSTGKSGTKTRSASKSKATKQTQVKPQRDLRPEKTGKGTLIFPGGPKVEPQRQAKQKPARKDRGEFANLFPTDNRLKQLSRNYEKTAQGAERGKVLAMNTTEFKYMGYVRNMRKRLIVNWDYPESSIQRGERGETWVKLVILKNGTIKTMKVIQSSGYPALDDAATTTVRLTAPFNPFPKDYEIEDFEITFIFEY